MTVSLGQSYVNIVNNLDFRISVISRNSVHDEGKRPLLKRRKYINHIVLLRKKDYIITVSSNIHMPTLSFRNARTYEILLNASETLYCPVMQCY